MKKQSFRFLEAVNIFLAITATLANVFILVAFHKDSSLHPPSKSLLRFLAITDLFVGILAEPFYVALLFLTEYGGVSLCAKIFGIAGRLAGILGLLSLFTVSAISVDRLLALLLGLRYRQVVTFKRVLITVVCFWTFLTTTYVIIMGTFAHLFFYFITIISLCLAVATCCYIKIFQTLNRHQVQIQEQSHSRGHPNGHPPLNIARYRKTVSNAICVQFSVLTCYIPLLVVIICMAIQGIVPPLLKPWAFARTFLFFNSTLKPILYCWNIREVRRKAIEIVRQILCRSSP